MALNLEEEQYALDNLSLMGLTQIFRCHLRLVVSSMKGMQTSKQMADLKEKCTSLRNRIQQWHQAQLTYTPCVASLIVPSLAALPDAADLLPVELAESMPLYLPSSLLQHLQQLPELTTVLEKECWLHTAQADDALAEIWCQHRIISGLW
jgi:hypothetical protein